MKALVTALAAALVALPLSAKADGPDSATEAAPVAAGDDHDDFVEAKLVPRTAPTPAPARRTASRRPGVATLLAAGGLLAGVAIPVAAWVREVEATPPWVVGGAVLMLGPSFGHWYAGELWSAGVVVRLVGAAVVGGGLVYTLTDDSPQGPGPSGGAFIAVVGGAVGVVGGVVDVATAHRAARRYNRRHVVVAPAATQGGGGIAVVGRF